MSGQGNLLDFEVFGSTDDSMGAVVVAGIPIGSGAPSDGQVIAYSDASKLWEYKNVPLQSFFVAGELGDAALTVGTNVPVTYNVAIQGQEINRESATNFLLIPGMYRLQFQVQAVTFAGATTGTEKVTYQFFNTTVLTGQGPTGTADAFGVSGASGILGTSIDTVIEFLYQASMGVRIISATGASPVMVEPSISIYKLN